MLEGSTFQVGDVVEITEESASTGMLDFIEGKGYAVEAIDYNGKEWCAHDIILLKDESGKKDWYNVSHFKLKEEKKMETDFRVGQTVWDVVYGKGKVVNILQNVLKYPVVVKFVDVKRHFTEDGKLDEQYARTLFFSEPKVIAETKPMFIPTLEPGTPIILSESSVKSQMISAWVIDESEDSIIATTKDCGTCQFLKEKWNVYPVGEKIEFN